MYSNDECELENVASNNPFVLAWDAAQQLSRKRFQRGSGRGWSVIRNIFDFRLMIADWRST